MANFTTGIGGLASGAAAGTAIAPGIGTAIGAGVGLLGGLLGGNDDQSQALALQQQAAQAIQQVQTPALQKALFDQYVSQGIFTPDMEGSVLQGNTALSGITTDPRLAQAQMSALTALQQRGAGGLQPQDIAAIAQAQRTSDQDVQSKNQQILQGMQQRGMGGSGNELASELENAQSGANRLNANGLQVAGQASQNALQALMNAGNLGTSIRGQSYSEQANAAAAQDAINRFNTQNQQSVSNANTQAANQGALYNLGQKQQLSNMNTQLQNQQTQYNQQLVQQDYENRLRQAQGIYGAQQGYANQLQQAGQYGNQAIAGIGSGVVAGANAYSQGENQNNFLNYLMGKTNNTYNGTNSVNAAENNAQSTLNSFSMPSLGSSNVSTNPSLNIGSNNGSTEDWNLASSAQGGS